MAVFRKRDFSHWRSSRASLGHNAPIHRVFDITLAFGRVQPSTDGNSELSDRCAGGGDSAGFCQDCERRMGALRHPCGFM